MKKATIGFCLKNDQVLLAMKKRGFGVGKWNGYGGKINENESAKSAMTRELKEESNLVVYEKDLEQVGIIKFYFEEEPAFECSVYLIYNWRGNPVETEEMRPQWYSIKELPLKEMWVADTKWLPLVLGGKKIDVKVNFNADGSAVKDFSHKPAEFD